MKFQCLVSRSRTRAPHLMSVEADDEACAAFAAWCDMPEVPADRPDVYPVDATRWIVSDGRIVLKVQILGTEND
jgi:hypothetical protein